MKPLLSVIVLGFLVSACASSKHDLPERGIIQGTIYSVGNEPFTKLALQVSKDTMYVLRCTKEIEKELNAKQGQKIRAQNDALKETPEGITVRIIRFEPK